MTETMNVQATYTANMAFKIETGTEHSVTLDGDHQAGASPMELLLASLAGCSGMSVISILQRKREDVKTTRYVCREYALEIIQKCLRRSR